MPVEDGVGYGELTRLKLDHFRAIVSMHIKIAMAVLQRNTFYNQVYHYIDANAGPGKRVENGEVVRGSPLIFIDTAETMNLRYRATLIERDIGNEASLRSSLPELTNGSIVTHCADQAECLRQILDTRDERELGLLFVDPTGIPDFDTVAYVSEMRPKMEILMYVQATGIKRVRQYT